MNSTQRFVPIYTTHGEVEAFLVYPYIHNRHGEWIGWVTRNRQVYSVHGHYVGWLSDEPRVLRKQSTAHIKPRLTPPPPPGKMVLPAIVPLSPMMPELKIGTFDVLEDAPELMPALDIGELRDDID